ncbi:mannonate dehydratase [Youxingia wuxianensis]|uniref:Mannonate dehydratase n=1 Tax=Youxingia wuxianensis TaxID=2763678 RepID=A0A926EQQ9_9FIRM|nr:mannonate dehydratase [Youxingia wuxianensis]MBC8584634.1 mannonate dehydratase [Youxingia wuxianensis]
MIMTFRWYGQSFDPIPLEFIRQIPGVSGAVCTLMDVPVGEEWPLEKIMAMKKQVNGAGLTMEVIESVNIHEDIKLGLPTRDVYIENYIKTIRSLHKAGVKVICYNFMPVFDWTRSELAMPLADGSNVMAYDQKIIEKIINPQQMADQLQKDFDGFAMPGWEPERLAQLQILFDQYKNVTHEDLRKNLKYFLERVIPVCEECDVKMAIHPDDPPWDLFGLPRIVNNKENLEKIMNLVDSEYNGITLCTGSFGSDPNNNLPDIIRYFGGKKRIHFAHIRNIKIVHPGEFYETSHLSCDGSFDMYEIMKAFYDIGFQGYVRPDHGRMIWAENGRPGYGLYDRALGITYLNGLWEALVKNHA